MLERKYLTHWLDVSFGGQTASLFRLGSHLEAYAEELNPQIDVRQNIKGEQYAIHNGYQVSSSAEPYYVNTNSNESKDVALSNKLMEIANKRLTGDECRTYRYEALFVLAAGETTPTCQWVYREDCLVVPQTLGGDTSGVQIPFQVLNVGNRVEGVASSFEWGNDPTFTEKQ